MGTTDSWHPISGTSHLLFVVVINGCLLLQFDFVLLPFGFSSCVWAGLGRAALVQYKDSTDNLGRVESTYRVARKQQGGLFRVKNFQNSKMDQGGNFVDFVATS